MTRSWIIAAMAFVLVPLLAGCVVGGGGEGECPGGGACATVPPRAERHQPPTEQTGTERTECEAAVIADPAFDASDERTLVGFADNVFVGRVAKKVGNRGSWRSDLGMPYTLFSVAVSENVKGKLGGTVTVAQPGGYEPANGCVTLVNEDPILKPGQEVLFVTRYDERHRWHAIVEPGLGDMRIEGRQQREALVRRFEEAVKKQVDPTRPH